MLKRSYSKLLVVFVMFTFLASTVAPCLANDVGLMFSIPFGKGKPSSSGCSLNLISGNVVSSPEWVNPGEAPYNAVSVDRGYVEMPLWNGRSGMYDLMTSEAMSTNEKLLLSVGVVAAFGGAAYLIHEATDDDDDDDDVVADDDDDEDPGSSWGGGF
jgi:hypothetical protein